MPNPTGLLVIGDSLVDIVCSVAHGKEVSDESAIRDARIGIGGEGLAVAVGCSRLGLETILLSRVGNDIFGRFLSGFLRREGVGLGLFQVGNGATGFVVSLNADDRQRYMISYQGENGKLTIPANIGRFIKQAGYVHVSAYSLAGGTQAKTTRSIMKMARGMGREVALDLNGLFAKRGRALLKVLPYVSTLLLNESEKKGAAKEGVSFERIFSCGVGRIILKRGRLGTVAFSKESAVNGRAFEARQVDSTGAGAAFAIGLAYSRVHGLPDDLRIASAMGAYKVRFAGYERGLPNLKQLNKFLSKANYV